jgi:hypothetical protein
MAVGEDEGFDVGGTDVEAVHVLDETAGAHAGVEEDGVLIVAAAESDQGGEPVLGVERRNHPLSLDEGVRDCRSPGPPLDPLRPGEQAIDLVVDKSRDFEPIDFEQGDRHVAQ